MIIADEGLNANYIRALREIGYEVEWIQEIHHGLDDLSIIQYAKEKGAILITEDKDFGEWVFAHKVSSLTIILLRYDKKDFEKILSYLVETLSEIYDHKEIEFIAINRNKVRRRKL